MPQPITAQECEDAAPAVYYELLAMVQARTFHGEAKKETDPQYADAVLVMTNCSVESFLLHYRALNEFFSDCRKVKPDNLRASDYLSTWKTTDVWVTNQSQTDRVHKRLAHLSIARTTLDNEWELAKMEQDVLGSFEDFIAQLPADRKTWFQQATKLINDRKPGTLTLGAESFSTQSGGNPTINKWPFRGNSNPEALKTVPRTRTNPAKLPIPIWKFPHCGNEHTPGQIVRIDGDHLRCAACEKDFNAKAAQKESSMDETPSFDRELHARSAAPPFPRSRWTCASWRGTAVQSAATAFSLKATSPTVSIEGLCSERVKHLRPLCVHEQRGKLFSESRALLRLASLPKL